MVCWGSRAACAVWGCSIVLGVPSTIVHALALIAFCLLASSVEAGCESTAFVPISENEIDRHNNEELNNNYNFANTQSRDVDMELRVPVTRATCGMGAINEVFPECEDVLAGQIGRLLDGIIEEYVLPWYGNISEDLAFPSELRAVLARALGNIVRRLLNQVNLVGLALDSGLNVVTLQVKAHGLVRSEYGYDEWDVVADKPSSQLRRLEAVKRRNDSTVQKLQKLGKLHPALGDDLLPTARVVTVRELRYLKQVSGRLTQILLAQEDKKPRAVKYLVHDRAAIY